MKTKLIFTVAAVMLLQSKVVFAVDNPVVVVEKEYQHELICLASTKTENFELNLKWSVEHMHLPGGRAPQIRKEFKYELKNLSQNSLITGVYGNLFGERADIKINDAGLNASGQFFMYKRLGYIQKQTDILLHHDSAGNYHLQSFVNKSAETFKEPKDYCNPPTRLCGSEPPLPEPKVVVSHLFSVSSCQMIK